MGQLCVNILAVGQETVARQFARTGPNKFEGIAWSQSEHTGSPILDGALAWLDCRIVREFDGGDHFIVVCEVHAFASHADLKPLLFFQSAFSGIV
jgi:flavin reductase (DIM6/NTAB) family NADH-FMN oxidoreductase RutF